MFFKKHFLDKNKLYFYTKKYKNTIFKRRYVVYRQEIMKEATEYFAKLGKQQYDGVQRMLVDTEWTNFATFRPFKFLDKGVING